MFRTCRQVQFNFRDNLEVIHRLEIWLRVNSLVLSINLILDLFELDVNIDSFSPLTFASTLLALSHSHLLVNSGIN
jgi:hypothetical protein